MRLSICATSYNEEEHIEFWYKHHKDLADEFILVDTESTDKTVEIAKKFDIKLIKTKWHHSFAEAKNKAIKHARGDWILMLSPDLWIDKENFSNIKKAIETKKRVAYFMPIMHHFKDWRGEDKEKELSFPKERWLTKAHICLFRNDPYIEHRERVHENIHDSIFEKFGEKKVGFLPATRHHDSTNNKFNHQEKIKYYSFLEDLSAIERKIWEHASYLRNQAYKKND